MARPPSDHPTELELEILKVLWGESPLAVRDVRERLEASGRTLSHSSVITMLNITVRKGYLKRKKEGKAFLFSPKDAKQEVTGNIVGDVCDCQPTWVLEPFRFGNHRIAVGL